MVGFISSTATHSLLPSNLSTGKSLTQQIVMVLDMSDNKTSKNEDKLTRPAAPTSTPPLAILVPLLTGNSGHIFSTPTPPLSNLAPSPNNTLNIGVSMVLRMQRSFTLLRVMLEMGTLGTM